MRSPGARHFRRIFAATLSVFLLTAGPVLADTVRINQVVTTLTNSQGRPDLRLNTLASQDPVAPGTKATTPQTGQTGEVQAVTQKPAPSAESALSGVAVTGDVPTLGVEIVEEGEVEGTICDCGEIFIAGGAFPKWPLFFLAAVPLVFINQCEDCDTPSSSPTPTPTPTPPSSPTPTPTPPSEVPEPASLLLFGTGLIAAGAGLRRRYAKAKPGKQVDKQEDE